MSDPRPTGQQSRRYSTEASDNDIRHRAYLLWEADGKPHGRADQYWHRAVELMQDEGKSSYPPSQSRGHRT